MAQQNGHERKISLVGDIERVQNSFADEDCKGGMDIEWRDIECFVSEDVEKQGCAKKWDKVLKKVGWESHGPPTKQIVHGACGFARQGEVLAVMGPSGSGKTTLLNVLAQRPTLGKVGYWTGEVLINGKAPSLDWERGMAYVMQKDIFYDELKVRENLRTVALLRLPYKLPKAAKMERLESMIKEMGLADVADTKIGTAVDRGLSGGEVKRTSIANETLALPRLFFLDEPLTGLDSTRAVDVMRHLRALAKNQGTTIMLTIHQPSSALYECFDRLLLLGKGGRTAFFGDVTAAVDHFSQLGRPVPPLWAPSDHYIELLSHEETRNEICSAWATRDPEKGPPARDMPFDSFGMPPIQYQIQVLFPRQYLRTKRTYIKRMSLKLHLGLSITWGLIYWQVGNQLPERLNDYVGAIFFVVAHWSWTPLFQGLGNFPREKEMLTKERASKVYDMFAYFVAQVLAEAPLLMVFPVVFFAIIWPMAGMPWISLLQTFLVIGLNIQVCSAMSMLISAYCMDADTAISTAIVVMVAQMCTGGYFADMRDLPWYIGWVRYLSFYYYTYGSISRLTIEMPFGAEMHAKALEKYSFSDLGYCGEIVALCSMCVIFRALAYLQLRFTRKLKFS